MNWRKLRVAPFAVTVLLVAAAAAAQITTTGVIQGTVADQSGAVLPGATVTLRNVEIGVRFDAVTDERGAFRFLAVPARENYELRTELQGFTTGIVTNIRVEAAHTQEFPVVLKIGTLGETITVEAAAPLVDVRNSITTETIDAKLVETVPLTTRHFTEVASLFAGIQYNPVDNTPANTQFHVRGEPTIGHGYAQDGANLNSPYLGRNGMYLTQNAIEKFEFLPGGFQAEYGEQSGGYINIITKSGTNRFAGGYSVVYKPERLGSEIRSGIPGQVKLRTPSNALFHEPAFGGPIVRDRLFYFAALQYRNDNVGNILSNAVRESTWWDTHLKLSYNHSSSNQWNFVFDDDPLRQNNTTLDSTTTPEAQSQQNVNNILAHLRETHIFNSSTVLETQVYQLYLKQWAPPVQPTGNPNITLVQPSGTLVIGQAANLTGWTENKVRASGKLTRTTTHHTIKTGLDVTTIWGDRFAQALVPIFNDRRPVGGTLTRTDNIYAPAAPIDNRQFAAYVQDSWAAGSRLTIDGGLRYDWERVIGESHISPRLGAAYSLPGSRPSKVYANYGYFYQYVPGTVYTFDKFLISQNLYLVQNPGPDLTGTDVLQNRFRNVLLPLTQPYTIGWSFGYEKTLPYDIRAGATLAHNDIRNQPVSTRFADRVEQAFPGEIKYTGLELTLRKLFTRNFEVVGAYTRSKNEGDTPGTLTVLQVPYRYATMDWDSPHAVSINGRFLFPLDIQLAGVYRYSTGRPYSVDNAQVGTLVAYIDKSGNPSARNIYRIGNYSNADMTVSRRQRLGSLNTNLFFQVFNVASRVNVLAVKTSFFGAGDPTRVDQGRQFQFGLDVKF
jgi:hypothetical protein